MINEYNKLNKLEIELEGKLCQALDVYRAVMNQKIFIDLNIPQSINGEIAENAIKSGYKIGDEIKYKITFEII